MTPLPAPLLAAIDHHRAELLATLPAEPTGPDRAEPARPAPAPVADPTLETILNWLAEQGYTLTEEAGQLVLEPADERVSRRLARYRRQLLDHLRATASRVWEGIDVAELVDVEAVARDYRPCPGCSQHAWHWVGVPKPPSRKVCGVCHPTPTPNHRRKA